MRDERYSRSILPKMVLAMSEWISLSPLGWMRLVRYRIMVDVAPLVGGDDKRAQSSAVGERGAERCSLLSANGERHVQIIIGTIDRARDRPRLPSTLFLRRPTAGMFVHVDYVARPAT